MRNVWFIAILLFSVVLQAQGQIVPNSNQAFQFAPAYNPAFTGIDPFFSLKLGYRKQWLSVPDAPEYLNLLVAKRLNQPADLVHNALYVPSPLDASSLPALKRSVHSIGMSLVNQKLGAFETLDIGVLYSFQYPISNSSYLSFGIAPSFSNGKTQLDRLTTEKGSDQFIDQLARSGGSNSVLNVKMGLLFFSRSFYLHASMLELWNMSLNDDTNLKTYRMIYSGGIGFSLDVGVDAKLRPSVLALIDEFNTPVIDYSMKYYSGGRFWMGVAYRDSGFGIINLGYEFTSLIGVSYSYELAMGKTKGIGYGSHELVIGLKLQNLKREGPAIW